MRWEKKREWDIEKERERESEIVFVGSFWLNQQDAVKRTTEKEATIGV